jgi:uncharacterized protein (TIRG00374 family)
MPLPIRIIISFGLLALVVVFADWRAMAAVLREVDLRWIGCAALLALIDRLAINRRWQILLAARGIAVRFVPLLRMQLAANFLGSFLPSSVGVDAVRIAALCRAGQPQPEVIAATLVDRATLIVATLLFGSAMIVAVAGSRIPLDFARPVLMITTATVLVVGLCLLRPVRRWVRSAMLERMPQRWRRALVNIADASLAYRSDGRVMFQVAAWTMALFGIRILFAKAVALSCGVDLTFAALLGVIPILWIVVMLPITVGGIGVQDVGYVALMALLGVAPAVAASMSLVEHVVTRLVNLPGALFIGDITNARTLRDTE